MSRRPVDVKPANLGVARLCDHFNRQAETRSQLCAATGIDTSRLTRIMRGSPPTLAEACSINDRTGVPVRSWLVHASGRAAQRGMAGLLLASGRNPADLRLANGTPPAPFPETA